MPSKYIVYKQRLTLIADILTRQISVLGTKYGYENKNSTKKRKKKKSRATDNHHFYKSPAVTVQATVRLEYRVPTW